MECKTHFDLSYFVLFGRSIYPLSSVVYFTSVVHLTVSGSLCDLHSRGGVSTFACCGILGMCYDTRTGRDGEPPAVDGGGAGQRRGRGGVTARSRATRRRRTPAKGRLALSPMCHMATTPAAAA